MPVLRQDGTLARREPILDPSRGGPDAVRDAVGFAAWIVNFLEGLHNRVREVRRPCRGDPSVAGDGRGDQRGVPPRLLWAHAGAVAPSRGPRRHEHPGRPSFLDGLAGGGRAAAGGWRVDRSAGRPPSPPARGRPHGAQLARAPGGDQTARVHWRDDRLRGGLRAGDDGRSGRGRERSGGPTG